MRLRGLVLLSLALLPACDPRPARRSVVLLIVDTLRADHVGCYGYTRPTTPNLDRLAAEGERFEEAYAQAPWTLPAVASILTGQPPHVHGAGRAEHGIHPLRAQVPTLAELVRSRGLRTGAVVSVVFCSEESGLARGFERYDYRRSDATNVGTRDAREATDAALAWVRELGPQPFFLLVHYFDAHLTYDPPPPFDTMFEPDGKPAIERGFGSAAQVLRIADGSLKLDERQKQSLIARYDGEIRYADEQIGRLRAGLEKAGVWDEALVIALADHGEEFWDHGGFEHGHTHHRELLRVPLIVRRPHAGAGAGAVRGERVRQVDLVPTILEFLGMPRSPELPGRPLGAGGARYALAEGSLWGGDLASVRSDLGTLIVDRTSGRTTFYAPEDHEERRELPAAASAADEGMARLIDSLPPSRKDEAGDWSPTPEQLERLRSLGYVR